jgi:hypothetical protein
VNGYSGLNLFVANEGNGTIGEYSTSGETLNASLVTGLASPCGIAVYGSDLFVVNNGTGTISEYTTSGTLVNASLVTGLDNPWGIAVSGTDLFVTNRYGVGEYSTSGEILNASLVTGLWDVTGVAVVNTPEPSTLALLAVGAVSLLGYAWRRRKAALAHPAV